MNTEEKVMAIIHLFPELTGVVIQKGCWNWVLEKAVQFSKPTVDVNSKLEFRESN